MDEKERYLKTVIVDEGRVKEKEDPFITGMNFEFTEICSDLFINSSLFNAEAFCKLLYGYIAKYQIILYSVISSQLYSFFDNHNEDEIHAFLSRLDDNLDKLIKYVNSDAFNERLAKAKDATESYIIESKSELGMSSEVVEASKVSCCESESYDILNSTKYAVLKIYDHIHIAQQQNQLFSKSDEGFKKRIHDSFEHEKGDLLKDMNSQLITLVSIFTAIAFLIFGGISSLDNIFQKMDMFVMDVVTVTAVWGLCLVNILHLFLSSIAHLTQKGRNDGSGELGKSSFNIYWWSNIVLLTILSICFVGQYFSYTAWFSRFNIRIAGYYSIYLWIVIGLLYLVLLCPVMKMIYRGIRQCLTAKKKARAKVKEKPTASDVMENGI